MSIISADDIEKDVQEFLGDLNKYGVDKAFDWYRYKFEVVRQAAIWDSENQTILDCLSRFFRDNTRDWNEDFGWDLGNGYYLQEISEDKLDEDGDLIESVVIGWRVV